MRSTPEPRTANVLPERSAPRWAAKSTPRARPLTTAIPRAARSAPSLAAICSATADTARDPTMATAGAQKASRSLRYQSTGGMSKVASSPAGNRGSCHGRTWTPFDATRVRSSRAQSRRAKACSWRTGSPARRRPARPTRDRSENERQRDDLIKGHEDSLGREPCCADRGRGRPRPKPPPATRATVAPDLAVLTLGRRFPRWQRLDRATGKRRRTIREDWRRRSLDSVLQHLVRTLLSRSKLLIRKLLAPRANP
jgi:hypothetical protein